MWEKHFSESSRVLQFQFSIPEWSGFPSGVLTSFHMRGELDQRLWFTHTCGCRCDCPIALALFLWLLLFSRSHFSHFLLLSSLQILALPGFTTAWHGVPGKTVTRKEARLATCLRRRSNYYTAPLEPPTSTGTTAQRWATTWRHSFTSNIMNINGN